MKSLKLSRYRALVSFLAIAALTYSWAGVTTAQEISDVPEDGIFFAPVGPITETKIPVVWDTDDRGVGGPEDMNGSRIGTVQYSQETDGSLVLKIRLVFAHPQTKYQVFLVCGPSHAQACGFITMMAVNTDATGMGEGNFNIPVSQLQAPPFGPGYRTDHIDLAQGVGDISRGGLTAGALNYFVPGPARSVVAVQGLGQGESDHLDPMR